MTDVEYSDDYCCFFRFFLLYFKMFKFYFVLAATDQLHEPNANNRIILCQPPGYTSTSTAVSGCAFGGKPSIKPHKRE